MKLIYATTRIIPSDDAQSKQIYEMCSAFHEKLGGKFSFLFPKPKKNFSPTFKYLAYPHMKNRYLRYVVGALYLIKTLWGTDKSTKIFTRDIGLTFIAVFCGFESGYEIHQTSKSPIGNVLLGYLLKEPKFKLICISDALREFIESQFGSSSNILTAHDGFNSHLYDKNNLKEMHELLTYPCAVHTGSLYAGRGIEIFIFLAKKFPEITFYQVGGKEADFERNKKLYADITNLHFIARQTSEEAALIQKSATYLIYLLSKESPVWWCTSPLKLFEYMASGNIIFCARSKPIEEILEPDECIMYEMDNTENIEKNFRKLLTLNPSKREEMAKKAQHKAFKNFSWAKRSELILDFFS